MIEYVRVPVTIQAQVFVPKDDLEAAIFAEEPTTKEEILNRLAREQVPMGDNFKALDIFVDLANAQ